MTDQNASTLTLLGGFRREWMNGVGGLDLLTQDPKKKERLCSGLEGVASGIESLFQSMVEERERVRSLHPWYFGVLLNFLLEAVAEIKDGSGDMVPVSRFEVMQGFGYWEDRHFNEWASEQTGVSEKTWRQWCHVTRTYFDTDAGKELLESQGLEPDDFVDTVPMGKATRAAAKVAAGTIQAHQIEALVDRVVSEPQLNHVLRITKEVHEQEKVEQAARDEAWVNREEPTTKVEWQPDSRRLVVKRYNVEGAPNESLIARLPDTVDAVVGAIQQAMIDTGYDWIRANVRGGVAVGLCNVEQERVEVASGQD